MKIYSCQNHTFVDTGIDETSVVIDPRAHLANFSNFIIRTFNTIPYAAEVSEELVKAMKTRARVHWTAISGVTGEITVFKSETEISVTPNKSCPEKKMRVPSLTYEDFLEESHIQGEVDLLKVDIENAELDMFEVMSDEAIRNIKQITVEFHDFIFPESKPRIWAIKKHISSLGFYVIPMARSHDSGAVFIRKDQMTFGQCLYLHLYKYCSGIRRILRWKIKKLWDKISGGR